MSNTISKPQKVLSQISPFSFYTGVAIFVVCLIVGLLGITYCMFTERLIWSILIPGIITLFIGPGGFVLISQDQQRLALENNARVQAILKDKYNLELKKNPLIYDELNCFLLSDPIPATLNGVDVEVLISLSEDETDVVACIFNSSRTPLQIRSSEK